MAPIYIRAHTSFSLAGDTESNRAQQLTQYSGISLPRLGIA